MGDSDSSIAAEARWRNYQQLIWTQQIQLQIQQQQQQQQQLNQQQQQLQHQHQLFNPKMNGMGLENGTVGGNMNGHPVQQITLSEKFPEEKTKGDGVDAWDNFDAQAAFLGPSLWDKRIPYDGQDFKLEYVDLEEFLTENGIPVESHHTDNHYLKNGHSTLNNNNTGTIPNGHSGCMSSEHMESGDCSPTDVGGIMGQYVPGPSRAVQLGHINGSQSQQGMIRGPPSLNQSENSRSPSPCGSSISRSSDSSNSIPTHHHYHELQQMGNEFDPRTRIFTEDELKPQPMIKKSKKQVQSDINTFVPDDQKDAKYWARRRKNNLAAKRSRDARRVKENQIAMRACFLEKENSILKQEVDRIQKENMLLKEQLHCCRREH